MNIDLPADTERALKELACKRGKSAEDYASELLMQRIKAMTPEDGESPEDLEALDDAVKRLASRTSQEKQRARTAAVETYTPRNEIPARQNILRHGCWKVARR